MIEWVSNKAHHAVNCHIIKNVFRLALYLHKALYCSKIVIKTRTPVKTTQQSPHWSFSFLFALLGLEHQNLKCINLKGYPVEDGYRWCQVFVHVPFGRRFPIFGVLALENWQVFCRRRQGMETNFDFGFALFWRWSVICYFYDSYDTRGKSQSYLVNNHLRLRSTYFAIQMLQK